MKGVLSSLSKREGGLSTHSTHEGVLSTKERGFVHHVKLLRGYPEWLYPGFHCVAYISMCKPILFLLFLFFFVFFCFFFCFFFVFVFFSFFVTL